MWHITFTLVHFAHTSIQSDLHRTHDLLSEFQEHEKTPRSLTPSSSKLLKTARHRAASRHSPSHRWWWSPSAAPTSIRITLWFNLWSSERRRRITERLFKHRQITHSHIRLDSNRGSALRFYIKNTIQTKSSSSISVTNNTKKPFLQDHHVIFHD